MKVIYASDENYFAYIYVSVKTLLESNKTVENLQISYIYQNVCEEKRTYLKFPEDDIVLFVDPDTLVLNNIESLFAIDFGNNLIAGVTECLPTYHKVASHMYDDDQYINGGMVLCNLKKWREENFEAKAIERASDNRFNLNYDQGIINDLCKGRIIVLHPKYNVLAEVFEFKSAKKIKKRYGFKNYYSQQQIDEALEKPAIIHFTGFLYGKPMSSKCTHPYTSFFQKKLKELPWKVTLSNKELDKKKRIRRWALDHLPFSLYLCVESILDLRRKWLLTKE